VWLKGPEVTQGKFRGRQKGKRNYRGEEGWGWFRGCGVTTDGQTLEGRRERRKREFGAQDERRSSERR